MRLKFKLEFKGNPPFVLPSDYLFELSEPISKIINFNDKKIIKKLEKLGYLDDYNQFNHFCFSGLDIKDYEQNGDRIIINNSEAELFISFLLNNKYSQDFSDLFLNKEARFGDDKDKVTIVFKDVDIIPEPEFLDSMKFRTVTPIIITDNGEINNKTNFFSPEDEQYETLFLKNLLAKYTFLIKSIKDGSFSALNSDFSELKFDCSGKVESRIVPVKDSSNKTIMAKGYLFDFDLKGPKELIKLGYDAGFGEKNNYGFGFTSIINSSD